MFSILEVPNVCPKKAGTGLPMKLTAKVSYSRVVIDGDKLADIPKDI
jgi:hypothetical protein